MNINNIYTTFSSLNLTIKSFYLVNDNRFYIPFTWYTSLFLRAIINIFIQVIFPNIITYLDRTFKEEQNRINLKMK